MTDGVVTTENGAAFTTEYFTLQSGDASVFGSAYTTIYFDLTASDSAESRSDHGHHQ
jgi:hypothetical protein